MNEATLETSLDPVALDPAEKDAPEQSEPLDRQSAGEPEPGSAPGDESPLPPDAENEQPNPEISADNGDQPDGSSPTDSAVDQFDTQELGRLREELTHLREEICAARQNLIKQQAELEEFRALWPDVSLSTLPDAVLEDVGKGVPLAAAYALMERRQSQIQKIAETANAVNEMRSSGAANGSTSGFLSAAEVRAMSPEQVHQNYQQILLSMPKWH